MKSISTFFIFVKTKKILFLRNGLPFQLNEKQLFELKYFSTIHHFISVLNNSAKLDAEKLCGNFL